MAETMKANISCAAAALALMTLGSCGGDQTTNAGSGGKGGNAAQTAEASRLFPDDFKGVCSGASVSAAKAYDSKATGHKAVYFATYKDDLMDQSTSLPDDWTVKFSENGDVYRAIDLVVCAKRTAARELKVCDGYKNDGKPTQNKVRWHAATYELSVREARTGRELAKTTVEANKSDCPWFVSFDSDTETIDDYASLSDSAVADFVRPHITG